MQISSFKAQRERDLLKLRLEKLQALCEENGIIVQEDDGEEVEREKLADEYAHRLEQLQNDVEQKKKTIRTLRDENEALENSSRRDTELLEKKSAEIEKLKKTLTRVQKESMKRAAEPENGPSPKRTLGRREQNRKALKSAIEKGRKENKSSDWMPEELNNTIKNFNDMFINNLAVSLTQIFVGPQNAPKPPEGESRSAASSPSKGVLEEVKEEHEEFSSEKKRSLDGKETEETYETEENSRPSQFDLGEALSPVQQEESAATPTVHCVPQFNAGDPDAPEEVEGEPDVEEEEEEAPNVSFSGENEEVKGEEEPSEVQLESAIENDPVAKEEDEKMKAQIKDNEQLVIVIDGSLKERERLLSAIKESHKLMQNDLLEEMKKEYHKKIVVLEKEIGVLNKEHKDSLSKAGSDRQKKAKVDSAYRTRIAELEERLQT